MREHRSPLDLPSGWKVYPAVEVPPEQMNGDRGMAVDTILQVQGMDCRGCAQRLQTALGRLDGVYGADPDHRAGRVAVRFDPDRIQGSDIIGRVRDLGFAVVGVLRAAAPEGGR
jgi:copper chaperone